MKNFSIRLDDEVNKELEVLAQAVGGSKNSVIVSLIRAEYDKYDSDPKIQMAFRQLRELRETFERFEAESKNSL